jgi:NADH-quinone oxidoreductase subunit L
VRELLVAQPWRAIVVPLAVAAFVALTGRWLGRAVGLVTVLAPLTALALGIAALQSGPPATYSLAALTAGRLPVGLMLEPLDTLMLLVVGVVASCVVLFSIGYMAEDPAQPRYFALLALFVAAMSLLVLADGLVLLLAGWELVGACSYLLIGFWFRKPSAANAALKAFLVTHVGDAGMLLGVALLWMRTGQLSFASLPASAAKMPPSAVTAIALLLLLGAVGKSAQFPLHFWLPDAMEGPTPVSALIHAATMVAAGVFLVARLQPLFAASAVASGVVLATGAFTALMAATIAVAQTDIKKVLAYSTISQLGFMFAALGVGAWRAAIFHLIAHAAFKALLFLAAGSVIHGTGTQELAEMGGLAKKMPATAITWLAGALALAGIPPLAGFFSKDAVVASVLHASPVAGVVLMLASLLTAFYITRATRLAFFDRYRGAGHPHEGGIEMMAPLALLAGCAVGLGGAGAAVATLLGGEPEALNLFVAVPAVLVAVLGVAAGWFLYKAGPRADEALELRLGPAWPALKDAYGFDGLVQRAVVRPARRVADVAYRFADRRIIDAVAEGTASLARALGAMLTRLQTGDGQWYVALIGAGVVVMMAVAIVAGR